jgi:gluconolactonase
MQALFDISLRAERKNRQADRILEVAEARAANITSGGQDRDLLFITASKNVYGLKMRMKGTR